MGKAHHPKAGTCVRQKLFAGVRNFSELELRIAALLDERARGSAFEVFAEAYLATQRKHDAAQVWPLPCVPNKILQTLGLASQECGVDGVFQTQLGHFDAYQVKFRTGRPALTWRELSTFMGLADSPRIRSRVLLTNCDDLPAVLNERQGFFCIRGSDLDRMEAEDFRAIEAWLADAAFVAPKKQPQPHQVEASDALLPALETHDRVSAIMACGTGKTLVALWVAERRQAARILVLVPSLALLRQILHEWLRETNLPSLAYLCVCSDATVKDGVDTNATAQSDLDFAVSTDAVTVREFLDAPFTGAKIVFSTYQSAHVVGGALKPGEAFDLAVFDEAHKTAGREGRNYAFALEDANLPIRKRLFLTATPRHYNPHQRDKEGEAKLVFSMDRPDVYGPQAFRLTFAEAARRGIICGYKVIISAITSEMVTNELLSRGEVLVNGNAVRARQVANQIALRDAVEKYGVKKVFTFHRTVDSAASFVADGSEGVRTHLPDFGTFHVNGTMPTARREREMRDFRAATRAIMSNARCLTEGVDVPAVDMVAFLSPRRSRVDIVQATGRAMRRSPGKTTGYVLVPLYLEQAVGETIEQAISRAAFDEVWEVLQSLQEQDAVLAEIIREMREQLGRTKGFGDARFRERVVIVGPKFSLAAIRRSITTACIEHLSSPWEERFGELKSFKRQFGHCEVPVRWERNPRLAHWVNCQRQHERKDRLDTERRQQLDQIGFAWDPFEQLWQKGYEELVQFKARNRHCNVPDDWPDNPSLAKWVSYQRRSKKVETLTRDRSDLLNEIGFVWDTKEDIWNLRLKELHTFKDKNGHCEVPARWRKNRQLSTWVQHQRRAWNAGFLGELRANELRAIGFNFDPFNDRWETMFDQLKSFKKTQGHCIVPRKWNGSGDLAKWVYKQRRQFRDGKLNVERKKQLSAIGFSWDANGDTWSTMFDLLKRYKARTGHCLVPARSLEERELCVWVAHQRQARKAGRLNDARTKALEQIGFIWDPFDSAWEEMFQQLLVFKKQFRNCNVPARWAKHPKLARWVSTQRTGNKRGLLAKSRVERLDKIGFQWDVRS